VAKGQDRGCIAAAGHLPAAFSDKPDTLEGADHLDPFFAAAHVLRGHLPGADKLAKKVVPGLRLCHLHAHVFLLLAPSNNAGDQWQQDDDPASGACGYSSWRLTKSMVDPSLRPNGARSRIISVPIISSPPRE